jgi:hypothetical protein
MEYESVTQKFVLVPLMAKRKCDVIPQNADCPIRIVWFFEKKSVIKMQLCYGTQQAKGPLQIMLSDVD